MQRGAAELRRADLTSTILHFMNGSQQKALAKQKAPTSLFRNFYFGEDVVPAKKHPKTQLRHQGRCMLGFETCFHVMALLHVFLMMSFIGSFGRHVERALTFSAMAARTSWLSRAKVFMFFLVILTPSKKLISRRSIVPPKDEICLTFWVMIS